MAEPIDQPDGAPGGDEANDGGHPPLERHTGQPHVHADPPVLVHDLLLAQNVGNNFCLSVINHGVQRSEIWGDKFEN